MNRHSIRNSIANHRIKVRQLLSFCLVVLSSSACVANVWVAPQEIDSPKANAQEPARVEFDERKLTANGIQTFKGKHLILHTDVRDRQDVSQLVDVFDLAVPQWCEYFGVDSPKAQAWQQDASIILDQNRFVRAGLFPADVPQFLAGFQRGPQIWVYLQQGDYYTRHLLLHEGTHGFMAQFLGGLGAPWYSEGMAELVGLNQWREGKLTIAHRITSRDEVPYWGRVLLIRQAVERGEVKSLDDVLAIPGSAFRQVESYAWAWAACEFLSHHPLSEKGFAELAKHCADDTLTFNRRLTESLKSSWPELEFEWREFLLEIDYGYDVARAAIAAAEAGGEKAGTEFRIASDRGWQATGIDVAKGKPVSLAATGEFQIAKDTEAWMCQPNGVTIEYYRGRPLGRLIAAILPPNAASGDDPGELKVIDIGERREIVPEQDGQLLLRINDSPALWRDNAGSIEVRVQ